VFGQTGFAEEAAEFTYVFSVRQTQYAHLHIQYAVSTGILIATCNSAIFTMKAGSIAEVLEGYGNSPFNSHCYFNHITTIEALQ